MAHYYFRLEFHLPPHHFIGCDETQLTIPSEGDQPDFLLKAHGGDRSIKSASELTLVGGRYQSEFDAWAAGTKARNSLMRCSIQSRLGLDLGKNLSTGGMSRHLRDKIASETGIRCLNDVHGLLVYDGTQKTKFVSANASLGRSFQVKAFLELFQQAQAADFQPTNKQEVAFELFSASQFETTPRSRFLTLVMAIEALLQPADRPQEAQDYVQSFIDKINQSTLPPSERTSLIGSLKWLFKDSIRRTGKKLADNLLLGKKYADKNPGTFFQDCYDLRSKLVHTGAIAVDAVNLGSLVCELEKFVADLLEASVQPIAT